MKGCRPLSDAEVVAVSKRFGGIHSMRDKALFVLGVCTGFRVGKHWRVNASDLEAFLKSQLRVVEADAPIEQVSEAMEQVQRD
jgi:hypothetical protein